MQDITIKNAKSEKERVERTIEWLSRYNNSEKEKLLSEMFVCRFNSQHPQDCHGFIILKQGIFTDRTPKIINRCRFYAMVTVDLEHIVRYCCGHFEGCLYYARFKRSTRTR